MASTNKTALGLVEYGLDDIPDQADTNEDNRIITEEFQKRPAADENGKYPKALHSDTAGTADYAKDAVAGSTLDTRVKAAQTQADKYTQASQAKVNALPAAAPGASGGLALYSQGIVTCTHVKSGAVHALTGPAGAKQLAFVATASFTDGDTFTVNGTAATAKTIDGAVLHTGDFVSGQVVSVALEGSVLTFQFRSYYAALQTKANQQDHNLLTYTALEQFGLSGTVTMDQVCAALPRDSILQLGNSINFENRITDVTGKYVEITITNAKGYVHCTEYDTSSKIWYQGWYPPFSGWVPLPTGTPPEEHDLPLVEGTINQTGRLSTYRKNQFGEVLCDLQIQFTAVKPGGTILSTLPIGYRPSRYTTVYQTADQALDVSTYGSILYNGRDTRVNEYMHVQFSFYAVS